jgi:hypothetical protein
VATFAAMSSIELAVKGFPPSVVRSMSNARETSRDNSMFTAGAKMDVYAIVRSGDEATII